MVKIVFLGAGSSVFAKNLLGDVMLAPSIRDSYICLYDIDAERLKESKCLLDYLNASINNNRAKIKTYLGVKERLKALKNADFVINAIQVGGFDSTLTDFEIPKQYGLCQTIGDTVGIGGVFRALRTIPVMLEIAEEIEAVCPNAWFLNYSNPMAMLTGAMLLGTRVKTVGLCHSVQVCVRDLLSQLGIEKDHINLQSKIAGINHMSWLLELSENGKDIYPEIRQKALCQNETRKHSDMVRFELMKQFGYYLTESSEHNAEYTPYWIKATYPELIEKYNIPLDEYPRRCISQTKAWKEQYSELLSQGNKLEHIRSHEYGSYIIEAIVSDKPQRIHGNVLNTGLISNLPQKCVVEVPCMVDRSGVQGCFVGDLPIQCASLNITNINVQLLTIDAALSLRKDRIYQAVMLDPHTASELPLDRIQQLCDDLIKAHCGYLPKFN